MSAALSHDWFPAALPPNVTLGEGTWLYSAFAFSHFRSQQPQAVRVGKSSGIYNGSFFDLGPGGTATIGDYCTLVGAIFATDGQVRIGDYCFVAHEVVFGDCAFAQPGGAPAVGAAEGEADGEMATRRSLIELGNDVWVGAGAIILGGARIGDGAIIGAAAVVDFEVPAYGIVAGNPARVVGYARPGAAPPQQA